MTPDDRAEAPGDADADSAQSAAPPPFGRVAEPDAELRDAARVAATDSGDLFAFALARPIHANRILRELRACITSIDPTIAKIVGQPALAHAEERAAEDLLVRAVNTGAATRALAGRLMQQSQLGPVRESDLDMRLRVLRATHERHKVDRAEESVREAMRSGDLPRARSAVRRLDEVERSCRAYIALSANATEVVPAARLLADLKEGRIAEPAPLIDGMLLHGDGLILYGPPGAGKSQFALLMAVGIAAGGNRVPHLLQGSSGQRFRLARGEPTSVLVVSGEDVRPTVAGRLARLVARLGLEPADLALKLEFTERGIRSLADDARLSGFLDAVRIHDPSVVILDNLTVLAEGVDRASDAEVRGWLSRVADVLKDDGRTLVLIGHTAKEGGQAGQRGDLDRLFGSFAWSAWADGCILIDRERSAERRLRLVHTKARRMAQFESLTIAPPSGDCLFALSTPEAGDARRRRGLTAKAFLDALKPGEQVTKSELCRRLNTSLRTFERSISGLLKQLPNGAIRSVHRGAGKRTVYIRAESPAGCDDGRMGGDR